ncbi:hypothetical protein QBC46DRAFT_315808 [Diplogelasinospora grovesii]|uniref:BTB domain-containing protein n=1 Tax=Diplogelasinospora grovesii TaxID=303347 RepID=A0AAN6S488_9PEZI|nr:hypothetical protein QBC46DRAFT_315808 [Diplogelasinospora grovesii]
MVLPKYELEAKLKDDKELIRSGVLRNEHPLDPSSEFEEFIEACRRNDIKRCQELMSAGVNINGKDQFDYTPLVIASLCGHYVLVKLLLDSGALADPGSFERERAVYNALTPRIRNLLLSYDYSKAADPLQPWYSHITSLLTREKPKTSDITLVAAASSFHLHKFILSARSPYFRRKFADNPGLATYKVSPAIPVEALGIVLRYLYLGQLPSDLVGPGSRVSEEEVFKGIDKLCKQLEINTLWESVLTIYDRRLARQRHQDEVRRAQQQVGDFFRDTVLKHKMVVDSRKANDIRWPHDNAIFANCLLRADELEGGEEDDHAANETRNGIPIGPAEDSKQDANNATQNGTRRQRKSVLYPAHKAFLIRSPYYATMFSSEFKEAKDAEHLHIIKVDCVPEVLEIVLSFLYTEKAECPLEFALDLLYVSDMLLLDKLKTKAAITISTLGSSNRKVLMNTTPSSSGAAGECEQQQQEVEVVEVEPINVYDVIRAAWDLKVRRLEEFAARYLASRLEDYIDEDEFIEVIRESASRIKDRQETDTIELLDDIRYYLSERFRLRFEGEGIEDMMDENQIAQDSQGGEAAETVAAVDGLVNGNVTNGVVPADGAEPATAQDRASPEVSSTSRDATGLRTLDGELVEDEFDADAINYELLLNKIDAMLKALNLDA